MTSAKHLSPMEPATPVIEDTTLTMVFASGRLPTALPYQMLDAKSGTGLLMPVPFALTDGFWLILASVWRFLISAVPIARKMVCALPAIPDTTWIMEFASIPLPTMLPLPIQDAASGSMEPAPAAPSDGYSTPMECALLSLTSARPTMPQPEIVFPAIVDMTSSTAPAFTLSPTTPSLLMVDARLGIGPVPSVLHAPIDGSLILMESASP